MAYFALIGCGSLGLNELRSLSGERHKVVVVVLAEPDSLERLKKRS